MSLFDSNFYDLNLHFFNDFVDINPFLGFTHMPAGGEDYLIPFTGNSVALNSAVESGTVGSTLVYVRKIFNENVPVTSYVDTDVSTFVNYFFYNESSTATTVSDISVEPTTSFVYRRVENVNTAVSIYFSPILDLTKVTFFIPGDFTNLSDGQVYSDNGVVKIVLP